MMDAMQSLCLILAQMGVETTPDELRKRQERMALLEELEDAN